jgi:signal transduction histidine kinase
MKAIVLCALLFVTLTGKAQYNPLYWEEFTQAQIDSITVQWRRTDNDTLRLSMARSLQVFYSEWNRDTALYYMQQQLALARKLNQRLWEADALDAIGNIQSVLKNYPESLKSLLNAFRILEDEGTEKGILMLTRFAANGDARTARLIVLTSCYNDLGHLYGSTGDWNRRIQACRDVLRIAEVTGDTTFLSLANSNLGSIYITLGKLDSAIALQTKALAYAGSAGFHKYDGMILYRIAKAFLEKKDLVQARTYFTKALQASDRYADIADFAASHVGMARVLQGAEMSDSSFWYARQGLRLYQGVGDPMGVIDALQLLASIQQQRKLFDSAYYFQAQAMSLKDSVNQSERVTQFHSIGLDEIMRVQELEKEKVENRNRIRTYVLVSGITVLAIILVLLYRISLNRRKTNQQLQTKNDEIERAMNNLKSTQAQLIQSEKMASLGELTAGIAHEIQNPLNFVNNFSEVNAELLDELKQELANGNTQSAMALADSVRENQEKINHHGRRADGIVKGMLQHSRTSSGQKEPTDINALCDEYLRLAYHGLRAKDKSFNAKFETQLEPALPKINVVPQEIGRVVLNLINNAFYAVSERAKREGTSYQPQVTVTTKKTGDKIEIQVSDNGPGIPDSIREKIFQPFFTTKPTGQGTGLGLSLSYDIVKAHGGEIEVEAKENEGTTFKILIPTQ